MRKPILETSLLLMVAVGLGLVRGTASAGAPEITSNVETLPDGHVRLTAVNSSPLPITALAAVGTRTLIAKPVTVRSIRFFDSVLNPFGPREIMPNGRYSFSFSGTNPPADKIKQDIQLKAAIFADGSTWGEPEWISTLVLRRSAALKYNSEALQVIEAASSNGSTREELIGQLTQLQTEEKKAAGTAAQKQMAQFSFAEALLGLQDSTRADGGEVPLSESIGRGRSRLELRISLLIASKNSPTVKQRLIYIVRGPAAFG